MLIYTAATKRCITIILLFRAFRAGGTLVWRPSLSGVYIHCIICVFVLSLLLDKVRPSVLFKCILVFCYVFYSRLGEALWGSPVMQRMVWAL